MSEFLPTHLVARAFLFAAAGVVASALPAALQADEFTIQAEADVFVDPLVPIPQGQSGSLAVSYDPSFGTIARSYLRFPLPSLSGASRIVVAKLNLRATLAAGGGGTVDVHRSGNDTWNETAMMWASQPGFDPAILTSATVTGFGPINTPVSFNLANWAAAPDLADGKVTFVLKARETNRLDGVNFSSREGAVKPTLYLATRVRGLILNGNLNENLSGHQTSGNVTAVPHPDDPSNTVAKLSTASPAILSQTVDTPYGPFGLVFRAEFLTETGTFTILVDGEEVGSWEAPRDPPGGLLVHNRNLRGLNDVEVAFRLDGPDGTVSELLLDDLGFFELPEPELAVDLDPSGANLEVSFEAEEGGWYQLQQSENLVDWEDYGRVIAPLGFQYRETIPVDRSSRFFRLTVLGYYEGMDVEVVNWGFESPALVDNQNVNTGIAGWTATPGAGVWNPPPAQFGGEAPEGSNVAFVNNNNSIRQALGAVLEPFRRYRLDFAMGKRTDIGWPTASGPHVRLMAGGVVLDPVEADRPVPSPGQFEYWRQVYLIDGDHPQLGQALEIEFDGGVSGVVSQFNADDVVLVIE